MKVTRMLNNDRKIMLTTVRCLGYVRQANFQKYDTVYHVFG